MSRKSITPPTAINEEDEDLPLENGSQQPYNAGPLDEEGKVAASIATTQELFDDEVDVFSTLTERQKEVYSMRLQGMSQARIAKILGIRQNAVYTCLQDIHQKHLKKGIPLDPNRYTTNLMARYDMVEAQLWRLYHKAGAGEQANHAVQMQAMQQLVAVQRERTRQLMDLGLIQKQKVQVEHTFKAQGPTMVDEWESTGRAKFAEKIIESQLQELPAPQPPEEDGIIDAEIEES